MASPIAAVADTDAARIDDRPARWGAVYAMALCSFVLIASEFMPVSLLSPIAHTLNLTEGKAGQAISISGLFAVITSLSLSSVLGKTDRRIVLLVLTSLLVVSGAIVAFAPTYLVFMAGRALLGIAIGGFWSMSAAIAMRLVPSHAVPKALAVISGGNALATVLAAPLGSFVGSLIGWRGAFFCVVPVAVAAVIWQALTLPPLPVAERQSARGMFALLRRPPVVFGLLTVAMLFVGQFALFTYLRPFLEQVTHVSPAMLSIMLLILGVSGFIGTVLIGRVLNGGLFLTLAVLPALMAATAAALTVLGTSVVAVGILLAVWGFAGTSAPVAWWTWLARTVPDEAEAGGGLMVAIVQLAITLGATMGGIVFDAAGPRAEFLASAGLLAIAALAAVAIGRADRRPAAPAQAVAA
ncbi:MULTISPECIES: MFS transporter [Sphingomonas]|jgi:predicted MFS family arabinose efflux permease|uniref:MFS transporter n=1 Tax=Sphingomonas cynarae TaxID=930197 RepID=A0ABP7EAH8_9SPHN|nr:MULTISPECIES: MFS transporter [Sphingomonas]MDY0969214.1 MFS transporter [Sphingomonas sp. CFBP9021]USR01828.1 MFS transporter [Sphingomonas aerolata]